MCGVNQSPCVGTRLGNYCTVKCACNTHALSGQLFHAAEIYVPKLRRWGVAHHAFQINVLTNKCRDKHRGFHALRHETIIPPTRGQAQTKSQCSGDESHCLIGPDLAHRRRANGARLSARAPSTGSLDLVFMLSSFHLLQGASVPIATAPRFAPDQYPCSHALHQSSGQHLSGLPRMDIDL